MLLTKTVKIRKTDNLTSMYIDAKLKEMGFNKINWAIVDVDDENYIVNVSVII